MINSFGHQTIRKTLETVPYRERKGPIKSLMTNDGKPKEKPPFAGEGYYFWEDNIEAAEWWGNVRYKRESYRVFRIDLLLRYDDNSLFDLIGSRQHLKLLEKLVEKARRNIDCKGWKLHNFISYFRKVEEHKPGAFPYKMIRFNDYNLNPKFQNYIQLSDNHSRFLMNPFYIVCVFDLAVVNLKSFIFIK